MFGSTVLEIAIGLVFVYLVLSLVVTAGSELVASWLKWRATNLFQGIGELLRDPQHGGKWAEKLYAHPLVSALSLGQAGKPSYIPSRTFAVALLDVVAPVNGTTPRTLAEVRAAIGTLPDGLNRVLAILLNEAGHDLEKFKTAIEVWFNGSMERVSGWYKRKAQTLGLIAAAIVTLAFNADTLSIVRALSNEKLRASVLSQAEAAVRQAAPLPPAATTISSEDREAIAKATAAAQAQFEASIVKVQKLGLPIGWRNVTWSGEAPGDTALLWLTRVLGWLLTICAVTLGAPFWFDLLNKFMNIRASGKAPEEGPKDPKELPRPVAAGAITPLGSTISIVP